MHSSVRLWSHDAVCLNGLLLENIIVLLPCIFVIAAKVTSEFLPTGWARSTGSAWAWWISRSAGKMVCVLFKLQVEAKGRFWRRWRDPSTLRNGFHPLVSSLKAAFFFLLRRCHCWLGIYHADWEQCKILHVCKSWWSVIWVHFKVVNSNRTFWPLLFEFRLCIYLFCVCHCSPLPCSQSLPRPQKTGKGHSRPTRCSSACLCLRMFTWNLSILAVDDKWTTPEILTQFQLFFATLPAVFAVPCASFSWTRKEFRLKDFTDMLFFSVHPLCKGYETKAKGSLQSGKAPGWESRWVGDTALTLPGPRVGNCCCPFLKGGTSRTLAWSTVKIHVGAQSDWLSAEWTWTWFIVPLWQSPHSCPGHLLLGTRGV